MAVGNSGYIQLRRGLSEHVRDGRLSFFEASLYVFILVDTNPATGICYGSAGLFAAIYSVSSRTCRDALEKLEIKGYLKRFPTRGKHGSYPILLNKFLCSVGAMKGMYVNCYKSDTCTSIAYDVCDESVNESAAGDVNDGVNESAGSKRQETRNKKQETKKQKPLPKDKPPVDERFALFKEDFEKDFRYLNRADAPWDAREGAGLSRWLKANPKITQEQWRAILRNRRSSPVSRGAPLSGWIRKALSWLSGNADEWGKQIKTNGSGGNHAAVPNGKADGNLAVLAESINRRKHQGSPHEDGLFSSSENRQDDARTIPGIPSAVRPTSVSSSDGNDF